MAKGMTVKAEPRTIGGTSGVRRLRREGLLPGVVYGSGKPGINIQLNEHAFEKALGHRGSEHAIMDLDIEGQGAKKVLLQEIQHHPVTGQIIHVDFHEISMTKKLRVEVALKLMGEPAGVSQQGGVLEFLLRQVEVECLPTDIPESIELDVSKMMIGDTLKVSDIKLDPAKYALISSKELAVAAVSAPREEEAAPTPEVAEAAAAAEPEVLREKKPEEGEEAEGAAKEGGKPGAKESAKPAGKESPAKDAAKAPKEGAKPAGGKESKK
jgi:large subunit ribosomal protein L25